MSGGEGLPPRDWNHPETVAFREKYGKPVYSEEYDRLKRTAIERVRRERMQRVREIGALVPFLVEMFRLLHEREPSESEQEKLSGAVEVLFLGEPT